MLRQHWSSFAIFALLSCIFAFTLARGTFDLAPQIIPFSHYWEECVGSGHATLGLREDWRSHLRISREKLGFKRVRFHALFDDDMSVYSEDDKGNAVYSFFNVDQHFDFLLSLKMQPLVEISFMPEKLASGNQTIFHYKGNITPPKSWDKWSKLMIAFAKHLIDRYGIEEIATWKFEVWNEPNCGFWTGTQQQYFLLLRDTLLAIKSVSPRLQVGGPSTCQVAWIKETKQAAIDFGIKLDFISTHLYPTDFGDKNVSRTVMVDKLSQAQRESAPLPLYITEYNSGLYCCLHDTPFAAAFVISQVPQLMGVVDMLSYWTFSDIFEEWPFKSAPFQSGFGLMTIYGVPKPAFRAYELLHMTGNEMIPVRWLVPKAPTIDVFVTSNSSHVNVLISNYNTPGNQITSEVTTFTIMTNSNTATLFRIDEDHANPELMWRKQGSPLYPTRTQIDEQMRASEMIPITLSGQPSPSGMKFAVDVPPSGVASVWIRK